MRSKINGKGWKIAVTLLLIILVSAFLLPSLLSHYVKHKLESVVQDKTDFRLEIESITLQGLHGVSLHNIHFVPKKDKGEYQTDGKAEADWVKIQVQEMSIKGIKWMSFYQDQKIEAESLIVLQPVLDAFRDKRKEDGPSRFRALPSRLLRETTLSATIPWIEIKKGEIRYEEVPENEKPSASVHFSELQGLIHQLSSDSSFYSLHPMVTVEATGKTLGSIPTHITYAASTLNRGDEFTLEGALATFDASLLNPYMLPQTGMEIKSGRIDSLWFKWTANNDWADGTMHLHYHDLKMEGSPKHKPKKFVALKSLVSKLFVKEENLPNNKEKIGKIHFERIKNRFIFNYIWNSFKTGFASVVINLPDDVVQNKIQKKTEKHKK
jgi:hypothetical protein